MALYSVSEPGGKGEPSLSLLPLFPPRLRGASEQGSFWAETLQNWVTCVCSPLLLVLWGAQAGPDPPPERAQPRAPRALSGCSRPAPKDGPGGRQVDRPPDPPYPAALDPALSWGWVSAFPPFCGILP